MFNFFLKRIILGSLFISGLFLIAQANFSRSDFKSSFYYYYSELDKIDGELLSLEVDKDIEKKSGGDFDVFFNLYEERLDEVLVRIKKSEKAKKLTRLEGHALEVKLEYIRASQIYGSLYTIKEEKDEAIRKKLIATREKILEWDLESPADLVDGSLTERDKKVVSYLHALYADNLYRSLRVIGIGMVYAKEWEKQALDALRYDPDNDYAKFMLAIFYQTIGTINAGNYERSKGYLDEVLDSQRSSKNQDKTLLFRTWVWLAQYHTFLFNPDRAKNALAEAGKVYPKSGFLRYVKQLQSVNRTILRGDGGLLENPENRNFFFYPRLTTSGSLLFEPSFNFVDADGEGLWSLYIGGGLNYAPLGAALSLGVARKISYFEIDLGFLQKFSFSEIKGGQSSALKLILGTDIDDFSLRFYLNYGLLWDYLLTDLSAQDITDGVSAYQRRQHHAINSSIQANYRMYASAYNTINLNLKLENVSSFTVNGGTSTLEFSLPMDLFNVGWSALDFKPAFLYAHNNTSDANPEVLSRAAFFSRSPFPVSFFSKGHSFPFVEGLDGEWLVNMEFTYRFYPLYRLPTNNMLKAIYLAPAVFVGWVGPEAGSTENKFTYSILGNAGFSFPGGANISFGMGWNEQEGLVINMMAY